MNSTSNRLRKTTYLKLAFKHNFYYIKRQPVLLIFGISMKKYINVRELDVNHS